MPTPLTLREKRTAFTRCISLLVLWAWLRGYELALGEGLVAITDARDGDWDGPHRQGGAHYTGLGVDLMLYINGVWISDGAHPAWVLIANEWERMHELARAGLRFNDANHFSFFHEGRS